MEDPSPDSSSPPSPPTSSSSNNNSSTSSPSPKSSPSPPTEDSPPPPPPPSPPPPPNNLSLPSPPPPPPPQNSKSPAPPSPSDSLPPPASKNPAKSPPSNTPSDSKGDSQAPTAKHADLSLPAVIGIAVGFGLFLALMLIACVCCTKKKKKKKPHNAMHYYSDPSGPKGGGYYSSGPPPQWQNGRHDHVAKVPRPPGAGGTPAGGGWHAPPPTLMSSTEISSIYSGPHAPPLPPPSPTVALGFNKSTFTYEELATATNNFSQANLLGQGGFGYVHKGVLPGGKEIAVKKLKSGSGQGEREFQAEVDIISRVHHRHLVSLVGYCIAGSQRLLVYDFVSNKTLEYHLHGKGLPTMDWPTRLKIAIGAAKGLAYLHEDCHPRIIHRDIKSANILLDYKFEAMVADFGLAKLSSENQSHISTRVMGTFGYLAPEYASSGKLTEKSDVFSYGVMLLELITGKRPSDSSHTFMEDSLVDWARPLMTRAVADGAFEDLVDLRLENSYNALEMARMVACANACVRHSARRRPKMSQIVRALDGDVSLDDLNEGVRPGQSILFSSGSDYDSSSYTSNMNRIRKVTLTSPEYSGEYSGPITDFGQRASASSSDGAFSGELNLGGNQRQRPHPLH